MIGTTTTGALRSSLAFLGAGGVTVGLAIAAGHLGPAATAPAARVDDLVAAVVVALGTAAAAVLWFGCALLLVGAIVRLGGRTWRWCDAAAARFTPAVLRRAVTVTVTTGLGLTAVTGTATATEIDLGWAPTDDEATSATVDRPHGAGDVPHELGGHPPADAPVPLTDTTAPPTDVPEPRVPTEDVRSGAAHDDGTDTGDRPEDPAGTRGLGAPATPVSTAAPHPTTPSPEPGPAPGQPGSPAQVVVQPGDSLWAIAHGFLDSPSDAAVAAEWPRWYAGNRDVVGPDPDLIHPGQVLVVPTDEESR